MALPQFAPLPSGLHHDGDIMRHATKLPAGTGHQRGGDNPFCVGMALLISAVATALVIYCSAAILLLMR